jgi:hypothetical protein
VSSSKRVEPVGDAVSRTGFLDRYSPWRARHKSKDSLTVRPLKQSSRSPGLSALGQRRMAPTQATHSGSTPKRRTLSSRKGQCLLNVKRTQVCDSGNHCVRSVATDPTGAGALVATRLGRPKQPGANVGELNFPWSIVYDPRSRHFLVGDKFNRRVSDQPHACPLLG